MTAAWTIPVAGTAKVVRFNWPKYLGAAALVAVAGAVRSGGAPPAVVAPLAAAAGTAVVLSATSLLATWWAYDHRALYDRVALGLGPVGEWASMHAGFDDATPRLAADIGRPPTAIVDLAPAARPSLRRAIDLQATSTPSVPSDLGTATVDTVFVTLAIHEVRGVAPQRALFDELGRVLRPGGRLVITEHLRGPSTYLVYGPGALHFQPRRTWTARAAEAGFVLDDESPITPFVRRLVLRRPR